MTHKRQSIINLARKIINNGNDYYAHRARLKEKQCGDCHRTRFSFYQFVRIGVQGVRVIAVDHAVKLADHGHVGEPVDEIIVVAMAGGVLVNETTLFQFQAPVVVVARARGPARTAPVRTLVVVQQRLLQRDAVEVDVLFDVATVGGAGLAVIVPGPEFFPECGHQRRVVRHGDARKPTRLFNVKGERPSKNAGLGSHLARAKETYDVSPGEIGEKTLSVSLNRTNVETLASRRRRLQPRIVVTTIMIIIYNPKSLISYQ